MSPTSKDPPAAGHRKQEPALGRCQSGGFYWLFCFLVPTLQSQPFCRVRAVPTHKSQIKAKQIPSCMLCGLYFRQIEKAPHFEELDKGKRVICISALCCFFLSHYSSSDSFPLPPFILLKRSPPLPRLPRSAPHHHFTLVPHWLERHGGFQPTDSDRWLCRGPQWRPLNVIPSQLTFWRKPQSWCLTWRRPI